MWKLRNSNMYQVTLNPVQRCAILNTNEMLKILYNNND